MRQFREPMPWYLQQNGPNSDFPTSKRIGSMMKARVMFDGRNIYEPADLAKTGFIYYGIGRKQTI
jgi:hypothetical protein